MLHWLQVLGGLALFLFGINRFSEGMEKLTGSRIQEWLDRMTNRPIKGAFFGMVATALLRSSGLLMVTMIGLINTNLMTLEQAIGVMMGQEIGTTITAQIVAFKIGDISFLFIALGFIMIEFAPKDGWKQYGEIILGFGVTFLGMELMAESLKELTAIPVITTWLIQMGQNPLAGVFAGTVVTALVQSSSAVTGLLVAMGMSNSITLPAAIALLLGANIGSCVTGLIASFRLSRAAKRASIAQILINVFGVLLFLPFVSPYTSLVSLTSTNLARQVANAHSIFNIIVSVILFPFVRPLARLAEWLVPEKPVPAEPRLTTYIDEREYRIPQVALQEAMRELCHVGDVTAQMLEQSRLSLVEQDMEAVNWVLEKEDKFVDPLRKILEEFTNHLLQSNLSEEQQRRCFQIKNLLIDIERVGDLAEDLAEAGQKRVEDKVPFSVQAIKDLDDLFKYTYGTYTCALDALRDHNRTKARQACDLEESFDEMYLHARQKHIERLEQGACQAVADVLFIESLRNLERISDHADNIGVSVMRNQ